jgi:hypothetical protein
VLDERGLQRMAASPSIVVTDAPSYATASARQPLTRRPSTSTVQAPHCPWSHPFFAPVRSRRSRSRSRSDVRVSRSSVRSTPLIVSVTVAVCATADAYPGES